MSARRTSGMDRRGFLRASAIAAGSVVLAACGGAKAPVTSSSTQPPGSRSTRPAGNPRPTQAGGAASQPTPSASAPTPEPTIATDIRYSQGLSYKGKYKEAPQLAAQVKAGKLPPVEQRLPERPYVVPHAWMSEGRYGGTVRWICSDTSDWSTTHLVAESMYGFSPLRWLRDGFEIGPGTAESWEANEDLTAWTFHFRKGLRWSDGAPLTMDDVMFWWNDYMLDPDLGMPPDKWARSADGKPARFTKMDDYTLRIEYDSPSPLIADELAWIVNGPLFAGAEVYLPKHYMKQFHIRYNKKLNKKSWTTTFGAKRDCFTNPDCPTLDGWMLSTYKQGQYAEFVRNPYYYAIDRWGNQLPYMDRLIQTNVQDPQVMRLNIQQGKADYVHGAYDGITLGDVSTIKASQSRNDLNILYWDSGSGTGSMWFFNYDYYDRKYRDLFRNPKFRQALSLAYNRARARKTIYFNQGELTTGTMSPKAIEYHIGQGPQVYKQWRDSYVKYDPAKAKRMLDELGLKDVNGDGWREFPDGSKLSITLDYGSGLTGEHLRKNELLAADWKAVGINASPNPTNPTGWGDRWAAGRIQTTTAWEVSDAPNCLMFPNWMIPLDNQRWAPLEGTYWTTIGTKDQNSEKNVDPWKRHPPRLEPDPNGPVQRMWDLYRKGLMEPDFMKRTAIVWDIMKIQMEEGPFFSGTIANYPQVELVHKDMRNVPKREDLYTHGYVNTWGVPCPADYDPEAWYWQNPEDHA